MLSVLLLIFVIIIIVIIIYVSYTVNRFTSAPVNSTYEELRPLLKTGDIIMFSCHWHDSKIRQFFYVLRTKAMNTEYGHVGIIYRSDDGVLYLVEGVSAGHLGEGIGTALNDLGKGGIRIIEMDTIMREYNGGLGGGATYAALLCEEPIPNSEFISHLSAYKNSIFEDSLTIVILASLDILVNHKTAKLALKYLAEDPIAINPKITCSEFVLDLLNRCGRIKTDYSAKLFWPCRFVDGTFDSITSVYYHPPIKYSYP